MALEAADVFLDEVDPRRRDMQRRVVGEAKGEIFLALTILGDLLNPGELGDPVRDVNDIITGLQVDELIHRPGGNDLLDAPSLFVAVKKLVMAEQGETG